SGLQIWRKWQTARRSNVQPPPPVRACCRHRLCYEGSRRFLRGSQVREAVGPTQNPSFPYWHESIRPAPDHSANAGVSESSPPADRPRGSHLAGCQAGTLRIWQFRAALHLAQNRFSIAAQHWLLDMRLQFGPDLSWKGGE